MEEQDCQMSMQPVKLRFSLSGFSVIDPTDLSSPPSNFKAQSLEAQVYGKRMGRAQLPNAEF